MKVIVREAAYRDLDEIYAWIARDRPAAGGRMIDRIVKGTQLLGHFP
jgi:plasmid stabilization system protein ParE